MTTFEFFKKTYDRQHDYLVKLINSDVKIDSFNFVRIAWIFGWSDTTEVDNYFNIINVNDTKEMFELGYLKKWEDDSWYAKQI